MAGIDAAGSGPAALAPETYELGGLELARLVWTEAVDGERFDATVKGQVPCPKSLARVRRQMITETRPVAMACIGGMEGIVHEAQLWNELRPDAPSWASPPPAAPLPCSGSTGSGTSGSRTARSSRSSVWTLPRRPTT
ncbi:MAG: hypothetical protein GY835_09620 [bacterium]|nr:hypothetical protein [bacterium]